MSTRVIHTPDGFRDLYGDSIKDKKELMQKLRRVFSKYGYEPIETPTIEYFDVFSSDIGTTPSRELYKFFDREGNTLVLRPDFTPSVARAVAMHFPEEALPARLCYEGSTFVNSAEYQGRFKEQTQMGTELIGDGSAEADAEVIALTVELLLASGLTEFQVSVGEVDYFKALIEESDLDEEQVSTLRRLISNKNLFGVEEYLLGLSVRPELREAFVRLPNLFGNTDVIGEAASYAANSRAKEAIGRLRDIEAILDEKGLSRYVSFDFGMLSKFRYYTGIIFSAYTYGVGEPVAKGGRYDSLLGHFGKDEPAVGVGIYLDQLLSALTRQKITSDRGKNV
ncbi:MAG: ATP phosphoribosyltransferase regulatory subunit [Lachnospiraceae bacterium]|jgi:ATP phosphoribosyltransferase regulatory subunit|nr:ATP phosphoribosyltransferase regulatory subunit [Lachnospiraceae bacterium]MEE3457458.1 ATP phosphoribosyltransferase regulatory subunit [Lachnospiraceae bacterium]